MVEHFIDFYKVQDVWDEGYLFEAVMSTYL